MRLISFLFLFISLKGISQCVTYRIAENGDTLNCKDKNDFKQGKWSVHVNEVRGEPGFEEEGIFKNDKKEGKWRRFNLMGDLVAIENYRWGFKDGPQQYFIMNSLEHEESWMAIDPKKKFDTIDMPDLYDEYKSVRKIIKVESYAMRHGVWKYYKPGSLNLIRTENYMFDSLYVPKPEITTKTNTAPAVKDSTDKEPIVPKKEKPKAVADFEKKNAGKKKVKVIDGKTGN